MGHLLGVICKDCGEKYTVSEGSGFLFHILRCDTCGKGKPIRVTELEEIYSIYFEEINSSIFIPSSHPYIFSKDDYPFGPIDYFPYYHKVEDFLGKCSCGGNFRLNAQNRCPNCRSTIYKKDPNGLDIQY